MFVRSFDVLHHVLVEINEVVLDHYMIQNYGPESACKGLWYYNCFDRSMLCHVDAIARLVVDHWETTCGSGHNDPPNWMTSIVYGSELIG
jgi:hypothetical protein